MRLDPDKLRAATADASDSIRTVLARDGWLDAITELRTDDLAKLAVAVGASAAEPATCMTVDELAVEEPFAHHGDLEVKGRLAVSAPFLVTGAVRVGGLFKDMGPDSWIAIGGSVEAGHLYTTGELCVKGPIKVGGILYGFYNDNSLSASSIRARVAIEDDHDIQAKITADVHVDVMGARRGGRWGELEGLAALFDASLLDEDGLLDRKKLLYALYEGREVWRANGGPAGEALPKAKPSPKAAKPSPKTKPSRNAAKASPKAKPSRKAAKASPKAKPPRKAAKSSRKGVRKQAKRRSR